MNEHDSSTSSSPASPSGTTGQPHVDTVLESMRTLDELPVDEHVAVFETAHSRLREALSAAADEPAARG